MLLIVSVNTSLDRVMVVNNFRPGSVYRAEDEMTVAGGKALNVMRMASILGTPSLLVGFVGGYTGVKIKDDLLSEGLSVHCRWIEIDNASRICDVVVDAQDGRSTVVNGQGHVPANHDVQRLYAEIGQTLQQGHIDHLVLTGSIPPHTSVAIYHDLVELAKTFHVPTVVDVAGPVLLEAVKAYPWLIKINLQELQTVIEPLEKMFDLETENERLTLTSPRVSGVCAALLDKGVNVILTDGVQGSRAWTTEGLWHVRPEMVTAVNATGSGDAYLAGFLHGLNTTGSMQASLHMATKAAASNAEHVLPTIDPRKVLQADSDEVFVQKSS